MRTEYDTNGWLSNRIRTTGLRALVMAAAFLGGCRSGPGRAVGPVVDPLAERPEAVVAAERALRRGDPASAERILVEAGGISAHAPQRSWLLIDLWNARCAVGEARRAVDALPRGPMSDVLAAHAGVDP